MSKIAYDPTKDRMAGLIRENLFLRRLFYLILDLFFLRSWHVRRKLRQLKKKQGYRIQQVLDAGSGFGQYDRQLLKIFPQSQVKAVDIKEDYLRDCRYYFERTRYNERISFEKADLLEWEEEPNYDLVLCVDVLEHIDQDVEVMRRLAGSMKNGGYFVMHSPSIYAEEDAGDDEFFVEEHARVGYGIKELRKKMSQADLKPVDVHYTYGRYGHAAWVILIKYPMLWMTNLGFGAIALLPFWYLLTFIPGMILNAIDVRRKSPQGTGIVGVGVKRG